MPEPFRSYRSKPAIAIEEIDRLIAVEVGSTECSRMPGTASRLLSVRRVRIADGPPQRIGGAGAQHMPEKEAWLVGEYRSSGERKYYLSNLPADTPIRNLAGAIKARWMCEQAHLQLKEELGLDHFEGRS